MTPKDLIQREIRPEEENQEINLLDLLRQVLAKKWYIVAASVAAALVGIFADQLAPNQFMATTVVQIEKRAASVTLPEELIGQILARDQSSSGLATEFELIKSRLILEPVVEKLNLTLSVQPVLHPIFGDLLLRRSLPFVDKFISAKYARGSEFIDVANLSVSKELAGLPVRVVVLDDFTYQLNLPDGRAFTGKVSEPLIVGEEISLLISSIAAPADREFVLRVSSRRSSVAALRRGLSINERRGTGIVDFSFTSGRREDSIKIVNAVVASYQLQSLQRRSAEIDQSIAFIESQFPRLAEEISEASNKLSEHRSTNNTGELSLGTQELLSRILAFEAQLEELDFKEESISRRFTVNHPEYQALLELRSRTESSLKSARENLKTIPENEQILARLTENVEKTSQLQQQLKERVEQLRILKASTVGNIRVLEPAEVAGLVGPSRQKFGTFGFFLGLFASMAAVLLWNLTKTGIDDGKDLEAMGLPMFASILKINEIVAEKQQKSKYAIVLSDPTSVVAETIRGLRTGLHFSLATADSKSILITSCAPGDGKSFIAVNLAIVSAQAGKKVLLIDADMRRGHLRNYFGLPKKGKGLSELLAGEIESEEAIFISETPLLSFIPTGEYPPSPSDILMSAAFDRMLKKAEEQYDLIIIDSPPVLAVTDPAIIGRHVGLSLLVVQHLITKKSDVQNACRLMESSGSRMAGSILNKVDQKKSRYGGGESRYGYGYGTYKYSYKN